MRPSHLSALISLGEILRHVKFENCSNLIMSDSLVIESNGFGALRLDFNYGSVT